MADPIAYFITWSCYGTWLPGDQRGWVEYRKGWQLPDPIKELEAKARMTEDACRLDSQQREAVNEQIAETCEHRQWLLNAVNCRSNHLHVVLSAARAPKLIRAQLKAWCTRRLKELAVERNDDVGRDNWWAERGSQRFINDEYSLEMAVLYVRDGQDKSRLQLQSPARIPR
jgi:REP element-mobilizing transposase RayT